MATARKTKSTKAPMKKRAAQRIRAARNFAAVALQVSDLQPLVDSLSAVRIKLAGVDRQSLDDDGKASLNEQIDATDAALMKLRNAQLASLTAAFEAELPNLKAATAGLASSLASLNEAAHVINAVAGVLGVIQKIATLLA